MYITKNNDLNNSFELEKQTLKLKMVKEQLKDLKRRIDCDINYINKDNPITVNSLAEDIKNQLEEIYSFIGVI